MAIGQEVLPSAVLDVAEVQRLSAELEAGERDRSVQHAEQLRRVLALDRVYRRAGMELGTAAQVALLMGCSEFRANVLLSDAHVLDRLGALPVMRDGLLTVEQARVVVDVLGVLDVSLAASLWEQLHAHLLRQVELGALLPPARLRELLRVWLLRADPDGAVERRKQAQRESADVQLWSRDDGLSDLALRGLSASNAQACLTRIEEHADGFHPYDDRPIGQRRLDAAADLILGRIQLPFPESPREPDGCGLGAQAPCGADVYVHVMLPAALGASDEPAVLMGRGAIDREQLHDLLLSAPVLHRVWVDADGTPVTVDEQTWQPGRRDPEALRAALLEMASGAPPPVEQRHPVHPADHDPPHPTGPGSYVPPRRLKRLLRARAPRCEWPGCGRRSVAPTPCDLDHDLPWPIGATCACNLGPLCRRHHRIKQLGWIKQRRRDGSVHWTSPTGWTWISPSQHPIPTATRPIPPLPEADPLEALTPYEVDEYMRELDPAAAEVEPGNAVGA